MLPAACTEQSAFVPLLGSHLLVWLGSERRGNDPSGQQENDFRVPDGAPGLLVGLPCTQMGP